MECVLQGYAQWTIAYRFLMVKYEVGNMHVDTIIKYGDATLIENMFSIKDIDCTGINSYEIFPQSSTSSEYF